MPQESVFRGVIEFMAEIGVYDIILPFLLVFTIVFAILEKTKILGIDKIKDREYTKKNLNSIVAFVMAFFVIASTQLVAIINEVLANVVLLIILGVSFLMLIGTFFADKEFSLENFPRSMNIMMFIMFVGIVAIFLNAMDWLKYILAIFVYWDSEWASPIIFMLIILGFIYFITKEPGNKKDSKD